MPQRLHEDHINACALAEGLTEVPWINVDPAQVYTNMVYINLAPDAPLTVDELARRMLCEHNVRIAANRYMPGCIRPRNSLLGDGSSCRPGPARVPTTPLMKPPEDSDSFEDEEQFEPDADEGDDSDLHDSKAAVAADLPEALLDPPDAGGRRDDSLFAYLLALAISIGLTSLPAGQHDLRFTLLWMALAGYGVLAWLLTDLDRIEREATENLAWGLAFALILAGPLLAFGGNTLGVISLRPLRRHARRPGAGPAGLRHAARGDRFSSAACCSNATPSG